MYPAFTQALAQGRTEAIVAERHRPLVRSPYPAYARASQFCYRTKRPHLAALLKAKVAAMKAIGPLAAARFNDALREDIMVS